MQGFALTRMMASDDDLERFYAGARDAMGLLYEEHFVTVDRAVGRILEGADRETVVQDVFLRLIANEALRRSFRGGALTAWLATVARNQAIDFVRRRRRETQLDEGAIDRLEAEAATRETERTNEARVLVDRFVADVLPAKWRGVFRARFLEHLDQREAARRLGMHRTTLAYQELRIRALLERYLLERP